MKKSKPTRRIMWRDTPVSADRDGITGPPKAADMVDPEDPAYGHIIQAAMRLIEFGFEPTDPDITRRAIEAGRRDYEKDPRTLARRYQRDSVEKRYGTDAITAPEVVYYMRIGNRVKIGWSTNLTTRLATINPEELMAVEPGDRKLEQLRHLEFRALHTHGEWFRLEEPLTTHIAAITSRNAA